MKLLITLLVGFALIGIIKSARRANAQSGGYLSQREKYKSGTATPHERKYYEQHWKSV